MNTIDVIYNTMENSSKPSSAAAKTAPSPIDNRNSQVISPAYLKCPCCNRQRHPEERQTLDEPHICYPNNNNNNNDCDYDDDDCDETASTTSSDCDDGYDSDSEVEDQRDDDLSPGILESGVEYLPTKVLVEGWLHKKGTGKDVFGSRSWKQRYVRLVLAKVDGYKVDVPLLLIYWYYSSSQPSTAILLESAVIVPMNKPGHVWNKYCFNIIHVKDSCETTRTFTATHKGRDAWVLAMNEVLLEYSKAKSPPPRAGPARTHPTEDPRDFLWPVRVSAPPGSRSNHIPPHDLLLGENLLPPTAY